MHMHKCETTGVTTLTKGTRLKHCNFISASRYKHRIVQLLFMRKPFSTSNSNSRHKYTMNNQTRMC